ncbi:MAG: hypothetical protein K0R57_5483 [Paenibacillaceae bacterium]|nr:hypothetical protein [Paenibacillaceae bacterium]
MRRYNFIRPLMLIITALLVKGIITNGGMMLGLSPEAADNLGFIGMIITALVMYTRWNKKIRK